MRITSRSRTRFRQLGEIPYIHLDPTRIKVLCSLNRSCTSHSPKKTTRSKSNNLHRNRQMPPEPESQSERSMLNAAPEYEIVLVHTPEERQQCYDVVCINIDSCVILQRFTDLLFYSCTFIAAHRRVPRRTKVSSRNRNRRARILSFLLSVDFI
jgi:hypothetical protein